MADDRPYKVGYGKPPVHTRFQKGSSGFKGRRHKARATLTDLLDGILEEKVSVTDGGRAQRLTKEEIFLRQLVSRAIAGDRLCSKMLMNYIERRADRPDPAKAKATEDFLMAELDALLGKWDGGRDSE